MARRTTSAAPASPPLVCAEVRDRLADHVLALLSEEEEREVGRHLEWCAGCRKELQELEEGVAAVGLALDPIAPPVELEEKVVQRVSEAAGLTARERRKYRIVTAIAVVMTFVAIIAISWAAIVAGRFGRLQADSRDARLQAAQLESLIGTLGGQQIRGAPLRVVGDRGGVGQALVLISDEGSDFVVVIIRGLAQEGAPYSASLVHGSGVEVPVGELYPAGEEVLAGYHFFGQDLTAFRRVVVTDAEGHEVLRGFVQSAGGV